MALISALLSFQAVSIAGYMAFGNSTPGNILQGFSSPQWVIDLANMMVILHMIPAYQVYLQPLLAFLETGFNGSKKVPEKFKVGVGSMPVPGKWVSLFIKLFVYYILSPQGVPFRLVIRSFFVVFVGFLSICLPFFNDIIGLVGAVGFWPATVFFPIECWIRMYKPSARMRFWLRVCCVWWWCVRVGWRGGRRVTGDHSSRRLLIHKSAPVPNAGAQHCLCCGDRSCSCGKYL